MLSQEELLNSNEIYLNDNQEIFIPIDDDVAYRFSKDTLVWEKIKRQYSWKVWHKAISGEKADEIMTNWIKEQSVHKHRLNQAIEFATKKHASQFRKGTTIPYIVHPLEVLQILYSMRADTDLMIAGVLHDTVEDTNTTIDEICELFGKDVAELVSSNSEDKGKSWDERKQHTIDALASAPKRIKMLIMADKLSNLRSIAYDYSRIGNELWKRFNAPPEKQAWYYNGICDALYDMQSDPEAEKLYWEFVGLFKDVFVTYYIDRENEIIYQVSATDETYYLKKGSPVWHNMLDAISKDISENINDENPHFYKIFPISETAEIITRQDAELTEDIWNAAK